MSGDEERGRTEEKARPEAEREIREEMNRRLRALGVEMDRSYEERLRKSKPTGPLKVRTASS